MLKNLFIERDLQAMTEDEFRKEVERAVILYEEANGHVASRTWRMIRGGQEIEALSRLMVTADAQPGFKVLRDSNQLDKTFESVVVRYKHLFLADIVEAAQWRLAHPYELLKRT
jgi:hypothetical protein